MNRTLIILVVWLCAGLARADVESGELMRAMRDELARTNTLALPGVDKPYYVAYLALDLDSVHLEARHGKLIVRKTARQRRLLVTVRVGSPDRDSSNFLGGDGFDQFERGRAVVLPFDDDYDALRRAMWLASDRAYKHAAEALEGKKAEQTRSTEAADRAGDFSPIAIERLVLDESTNAPDAARFAALTERVSAAFRSFPEIQSDSVELWAWRARRYFVSSEGAVGYEPQTFVRLDIDGSTQADDGMELDNATSFAAASFDGLPAEARLIDAAGSVARELTELRHAPLIESSTVPVLFEGAAAAQLVDRLLAGALSGTPGPMASSSRFAHIFTTPSSELGGLKGRRVLPKGYRVEDKPSSPTLGVLTLAGGYRMDDEGVRAKDVVLIDDGKLERFMMSRTPRSGASESNGHGRAGTLGAANGRASNLIMTVNGGLAERALRERLVALIKESGAPHGLVVRRLGAQDSNATRAPVAIRVTPDGKEQLVRGADLGDLSLRMLKRIVAAGDRAAVVSSTDGDRWKDPWSGVDYEPPRSIAAPALLCDDVRVTRSTGAERRPPLIPPPPAASWAFAMGR